MLCIDYSKGMYMRRIEYVLRVTGFCLAGCVGYYIFLKERMKNIGIYEDLRYLLGLVMFFILFYVLFFMIVYRNYKILKKGISSKYKLHCDKDGVVFYSPISLKEGRIYKEDIIICFLIKKLDYTIFKIVTKKGRFKKRYVFYIDKNIEVSNLASELNKKGYKVSVFVSNKIK